MKVQKENESFECETDQSIEKSDSEPLEEIDNEYEL